MKLILLCLMVVALTACATPYKSANSEALYSAFIKKSVIETAHFKHRTALYSSGENESTLKVFIEGDGRPWEGDKGIRADPTPLRLLSLELLHSTQGDRLYLGRPCYFKTNDQHCHYKYWTSHRYNPKIVSSMAEVIKRRMEKGKYRDLVIIGHSGGGTLATLLACKNEFIPKLVTLAANLDIDNWTEKHQWSPLKGSQNPTLLEPHCKPSNNYHFFGSQDKNIPETTVKNFFKDGTSQRFIIEGADHQNWPLFWHKIKAHLLKIADIAL